MRRGELGRRLLVSAVCWLTAVSAAAAGAGATGTEAQARTHPAERDAIVDLPIAFQVRNTNTSGVPCASDGAAYTVRGQLVGPRSALHGRKPRVITVYLHGFNVGGFMWRLPGMPELDHAVALARLGHVSLTVDRLGYDTSGHPHGWLSCLGAQADVAHQLVEKLRGGDYAVNGGGPTSFQTVVLAGHDSGAMIADIAAYSYPEDIDALVHFNWAEQGFTEKVQMGYVETLPVCASGGQDAEQGPPDRDDPAGGPSGYVQFLTDAQIREEQFNTEPEVVNRLLRLVNRNPCGEFTQVPQVTQINAQRLPEIRIPVLYGYTEYEFIWTQEGLAQQAQHYRNSRDLTTVVIRDAGHFPQFSRVAPAFHSTIAEWLRSRGLVSAGR
jgi:pimeloyl-ACP methyl ester carboxylesterase